MHHRPRSRNEIRLADVVPRFFLHHYAADELGQLFVARAAPHLSVKIVIPYGKQARANLAVAGDADAAAMSAEGMGRWRDDPDLADAVIKTKTPRRLRARVRNFDQRAILGHPRQNFIK